MCDPSWSCRGQPQSYLSTYLVSHDHELAVTQAVDRLVLVVVLEAKNLFDVLNLDVLHNLVMVRLANIEELSTQGEDTEVVTPLDGTKTRDCKSFGGVSFSEDERAPAGVAATGPVGVFEFGDAANTGALSTIRLLEKLVLFEASPAKNIFNNARLDDCEVRDSP